MPCFIKPEPGRVGLSETEAHQRGIAVRVATLPMAAVPRARKLSETRGFMKAVIDVDNEFILGIAVLSAQAGEVIAVGPTAMWASLPYTMARDGIIAHPMIAEGLNLLFAKVPAV